MTGSEPYSYARSKKSDVSDELINRFLIRPLAGSIVRLCYPTRITPNQITIAAIVAGLCSAAACFDGSPSLLPVAGAFLLAKDILDSADGQLARARSQFSRLGRFLDSIGDIVVNIAIFTAIGISLGRNGLFPVWLLAALAGLTSLTLRVSYHVFYQTSFLHLQNAYAGNRTTEELRPEDIQEDRWTLRLHRGFLFFYGWQDRLMVRVDRWSQHGLTVDERAWYGDLGGIRWSGFLGLGTENAVLAIFCFVGAVAPYLAFNFIVSNAVWIGCILYRRRLARHLGDGERK